MEEYRDLGLTVAAFREVLDEPEFAALPAGVVLQAYLPDSYAVQRELTAWAIARCARGGAPIKLRIVKGANLAMERIEAARRGWPQAPYPTKAEVDANYKRMLDVRLPPRARARGAARHRQPQPLRRRATASLLRARDGVEDWVEFEMLEGMANHQARARAGARRAASCSTRRSSRPRTSTAPSPTSCAGSTRTPRTTTSSATCSAWTPESATWAREGERFLAGDRGSATAVASTPRRTQDRGSEATAAGPLRPLGGARSRTSRTPIGRCRPTARGSSEVVARWRGPRRRDLPLEIGGESLDARRWADGRDPSRPGHVGLSLCARRTCAEVDRALDVARAAQLARGQPRPPAERRASCWRAADVLARRRGDLIGAMILDGAKTVPEADPEVSEAIDFARYYADGAARRRARTLADVPIAEPLGVVVVAPPWNFPLSIPAGGVLAALAAGNAVILKPAPEAVLVALAPRRGAVGRGHPARRAPAPAVRRRRRRAARLITDPRVDAVILTGSAATARLFLEWRPDLRSSRRRAARTR